MFRYTVYTRVKSQGLFQISWEMQYPGWLCELHYSYSIDFRFPALLFCFAGLFRGSGSKPSHIGISPT